MYKPSRSDYLVCTFGNPLLWILLAAAVLVIWWGVVKPSSLQTTGGQQSVGHEEPPVPAKETVTGKEPLHVPLPEELRYLRRATVRIRAGGVLASGIVARQEGAMTLILTVGYVVDRCRSVKQEQDDRFPIRNGGKEPVVRYAPAQVVFLSPCDPDDYCTEAVQARIIRYTGTAQPALLMATYGKRVQPVSWADEVAVVHVAAGLTDDERFVSGTRLSATKEFGSAVYDLYPAMGFGGSGGGGIFLKDSGKCLGLLSHGAPGVTLAIPTSAVRQWAKEKGVAWAIDHTIPLPSDEELKKLPIEN